MDITKMETAAQEKKPVQEKKIAKKKVVVPKTKTDNKTKTQPKKKEKKIGKKRSDPKVTDKGVNLSIPRVRHIINDNINSWIEPIKTEYTEKKALSKENHDKVLNQIISKYERQVYGKMTDDQKKTYKKQRNEYIKNERRAAAFGAINLRKFNEQYDPHFYDGAEKFINETLINKDGEIKLNKLKYRIGQNALKYLAGFIEVVLQHIFSCAIMNTISLDKSTVHSTSINLSQELLDNNKFAKFASIIAGVEKETKKNYFNIYASRIFNITQKKLVESIVKARSQKKKGETRLLMSHEMCSYSSNFVIELINRICVMLMTFVGEYNMKTINITLIRYIVANLCSIIGVNASEYDSLFVNKVKAFDTHVKDHKRKKGYPKKKEKKIVKIAPVATKVATSVKA